MTDADDIIRRAQEISARAEHIAADATDSAALREELDRLDAELAQLDEEQRRLDDELRERGDDADASDREPSSTTSWSETLVDLVSDVAERITSLTGGWPLRASDTFERTVDVTEPLRVVVENKAGSVKVESGAAGSVRVHAEKFAPTSGLLEEMEVTTEQHGDELTIRSEWPDQRRGRRVRMTVVVPQGTAVRLRTSGGSVSARDTHAAVTASTKGGSITITETEGEVDARTAGGSVRVEHHTGAVHASTMGGSVHLSGTLRGAIEASTAGGSITIEGADGASVTASTSGGSIGVRGRLTGENHVRTAGGSIKVTIPPDSQLRIDAKGNSASSDFPELDTRVGRVSGVLGDGHEGSLEARTAGGSVAIRKG